jgi:hypothetical protein
MPSGSPSITDAIVAIPELVRADAPLCHRLRHFSGVLSVTAGEERWFLPFEKGRPGDAIAAGTVLQAASVAFNAAPEVWLSHWLPVPPAPDHDLFGLAKSKRMRIDGDMAVYMQQLQNIKDVLAKPRALFA